MTDAAMRAPAPAAPRAAHDPGTPVRELDGAAVERRAAALGDPAWLRARRLAAWEAFRALPVPTTRSEEWRYTDLARWPWADAIVPDPAGRPAAARAPTDGAEGSGAGGAAAVGRLVDEAAGLFRRHARLPAGVVFADLATALRDHADLLEPHLLAEAGDRAAGFFPALHAALVGGGVVLAVPDGVEVDLPFRTFRTLARDGAAAFPHTLVVAGARSRVTLVETLRSGARPASALHAGATEIVAGAGAEVRVVTVQDWGPGVLHWWRQRARLERDAVVRTLVVTLGGALARSEVESLLEGQGGTSEMLGLYAADGAQHVDHRTLQLHRAPHTTSDLLFKGALRGRSRAAFSGLIKVSPGAQRTDAYQKNRNLLLSGDARADSLPNLEIEADDVRCSHGATIGPADELQLFYLRSRGLTRDVAERVLVEGFFEEVLARLPAELRDEVRDAVAARGRTPARDARAA
jgi:Fe-S cluster assembly protein SufD